MTSIIRKDGVDFDKFIGKDAKKTPVLKRQHGEHKKAAGADDEDRVNDVDGEEEDEENEDDDDEYEEAVGENCSKDANVEEEVKDVNIKKEVQQR